MDNLTNGPYDPRTIFCGDELVATIETGHNERDVTYARAFVSAMNEAHKLRAENEELKKATSPWQTIDPADEGTLPPYTKQTKILVTQLIENQPVTKRGYYDGYGFRQVNGSLIPISLVLAWQPWPEPAPLPGGVNE